MRIASYFQRRRWFSLRPVRLVPARALVGLLLFGCFFELGDVVPLGVGGSGTSGSFGRGGGGGTPPPGGSLNGGSGGSVGTDCPFGQKRCGSELCVPMTVGNGCGNPSCEPCGQPAQATVSCNQDTQLCQVDSCNSGYADCDGNLSGYDGTDAGNGCEHSFGDIQTVALPLEVMRADIDLGDGGDREEWAGIPTYPLEQTCQNCVDPTLTAIIAQNEAPPKTDLDAYFRVAWDTDFFYVLAEAFDNDLFHEGATVEGNCQNGALCEDAFSLFFDGRNNRSELPQSGNDDIRVFLGLGGKAFRTSGAPVSPGEVQFVQARQGTSCYRLEAQVSWRYIVDLQGAQSIDGLFPPQAGQQYGFDISVNDWDRPVNDGPPQRQSQLFYVNPGNGYHDQATGYIPMVLVDGADAGP